MTISINKDEIEKVADELGIEIILNSSTPGVYNKKTGDRKSLSSYFEEDFSEECIFLHEKESNVLKIREETKRVQIDKTVNFDVADKTFPLDFKIA